MRLKDLTCCVCGGAAGRFAQHWNRDTGYGICARCAAEEAGQSTPEELVSRYGTPGVNYEQPVVRHYGRLYKVMAVFPDSETGTKAANAYMERTPGASVLCTTDRVYLAHETDLGVPAPSKAETPAF